MFKKFLICLLISFNFVFYSSFNSHTKSTHFSNQNAQAILKNRDTGVVMIKDDNAQSNPYKTIFPKDSNDKINLKDHLSKQSVMFLNEQNTSDKKVEYKKDYSGKYLIASVTDKNNKGSVTTYPVLRFISAVELENKSDDDKVYIATQCDKNKDIHFTASARFIKDASCDGVYLGTWQDKNKSTDLVDISKHFPKLYGNKIVERGSIAVETDWIHKKNHQI